MSKYIDTKVSVWTRQTLPDSTDMTKIVKGLEAGRNISDLLEEQSCYDGEYSNETLFETEESVSPIQNGGIATIEVFDEDVQEETIWSNGRSAL